MKKPKISRSLIHTISQFSNWKPAAIDDFFRSKKIYADATAWNKFIRMFLMSLGVAFTVAGIIFFFAFNWASLHKFGKLGLVQGLIVAVVAASLWLKTDEKIKGIVLTGAAMLVGALFAVFGQIYQTGANAYDFFLGWTIFVALWVFVSNFPPLWLMFITLINLTVIFYFTQVMLTNSPHALLQLLSFINIVSLLLLKWLAGQEYVRAVPGWLERVLVLASLSFLTISFIAGIFENDDRALWFVTIILTLIFYLLGILFGLKKKDTFYIATIGLSAIMVVSSFLIRAIDDLEGGMFFIVGFFVVASITSLVMYIISLNKKWYGIDQ